MNLKELREELARQVDDQDIATKDANAWINAAYKDIASVNNSRWSWLEKGTEFTTTAGLENYVVSVIAPDLKTVLGIVDSVTGSPLTWTAFDGSLYLNPVPSESRVLKLRYFGSITPLVSDTDVPLFDELFHEILVFGAKMRYVSNQDYSDQGSKVLAKSEYSNVLNTMQEWNQPSRVINVIKGR